MNRRLLGALTALPIALTVGGVGAAQAAKPHLTNQYTDGIYVVQMVDLPVVAYDGSTKGLAATALKPGEKVDVLSPKVVKYVDHLKGKHAAALNKVGAGSKLYDYTYSYNGFAANLTASQAAKLAKADGVLAVTKQATYEIDTSTTPDFLGLTGEDGLWNQLGGTKSAGEDIVIGIIDSGIWPEHPGFADRVDKNGVPSLAPTAKRVFQNLPGFNAKCQVGEQWTAATCNQKLVAAQYFNQGWGGDAGINELRPWEFNSARDYNGHGTHTAGTSGGNFNVPVPGLASALAPKGTMSGMAPRARISAYKALWSTETGDTAGGTTTDLVAAIDQAVADGVDVINYSISGTSTNFADPAEIAFLFAARAGVFVAASAGNSGPDSSTVAHPSPWITTVAAGTHNRVSSGSVTLGNGATYEGASIAAESVTGPFVYAGAVAKAGADADEAALCFGSADGASVLDPEKVKGKIVLCDRGVTARTNKSLAVKEAGGIGMVLVNTTAGSLNGDLHTIPSVHLSHTDRPAVKAYAETAGATATINKATIDLNAPAPFTAEFSSRGPLLAGGGDLLKPDVIAPGQDILAAYSPVTNGGYAYNAISGTSMSSPHVAGLAALLKDKHPTWSPMAIKSALMTTGYDVKDAVSSVDKTFRQGAGHVDPTAAADAGLVYDSNWNDWLAFLCGTTSAVGAGTCDALVSRGYSTDPSNFNGASIAIASLAGKQTVTRKVTNVGSESATYEASVTGLAGIDAKVEPATLTLAPGKSDSFTVTFTTGDAALNTYAAGNLTWSDGKHTVRSPIVVKPVALAAPAEIAAKEGASTSFPVTFGYDGSFTAAPRGLLKSTETPGSVADDPTDNINTAPDASVAMFPFAVPSGTTYARWSLFGAGNADDDLDLYLFQKTASGWKNIALSGNGGSEEEVSLVSPEAGDYLMIVHGWGVVSGSTPTDFTLHSWILGSQDAGNMTVTAPATATKGQTGQVSVSVEDLASGKWLGSVAYSGADGMPNPTIVRVDVP